MVIARANRALIDVLAALRVEVNGLAALSQVFGPAQTNWSVLHYLPSLRRFIQIIRVAFVRTVAARWRHKAGTAAITVQAFKIT